jgi:hydrogenase 3 maturation protease
MGDDAAGSLVASRLSRHERARVNSRVTIMDGGTVPENFTGPIRAAKPDLVILVDAADMGKTPGDIALADPHSLDSVVTTTHSLPLSSLSRYLEEASGAQVIAVLIQVGSVGFDLPLSPKVRGGIREVVAGLLPALGFCT